MTLEGLLKCQCLYLELHISGDLYGHKGLLKYEVQDTGIGISTVLQASLFERFRQQDSSTSRTYGGTGLGLSISKSLVELMHGEMGIRSRKERGTCFWF